MTLTKTLIEQWLNDTGSDDMRERLSIEILRESETYLLNTVPDVFQKDFWYQFLNITKKPLFLTSLPTDEDRKRWAELSFRIIRMTNYTFRSMMVQRVEEHPGKVLFRDMSSSAPVEWTYEQIFRHMKEIATVFYKEGGDEPRVAIYSDNNLESACTDLACLAFDIFDTPLSTHFSAEILLGIFNQLKISVVVTDTLDRLQMLLKLRDQADIRFRIFTLAAGISSPDAIYLPEACKKVTGKEIEKTATSPSKPNNTVATTMFTSGSTGLPKGVSFSIYNIVTKRFARAAALPEAGDETFLCYLPLFHTFGRFLEMTGAIFWNGTYIFAGNTSSETLLSLFPQVKPSAFISVPLRWQELYEKCLEEINHIESREIRMERVKNVTGHKLKWGLSAAGYLDPDVFRFFNNYDIHLNSGFGMTEATGGITMTPPGGYRENSVGKPLPGVYLRLTADSELEISGHYIAAYLEQAGPGDVIEYPGEKEKWLRTGDVFTVSEDGYYEIIDRVKDIYKNNRGQTIAPQVIEKKFRGVPGIKTTFLVGDHRPYNVLLIVPEKKDPIFESLKDQNVKEYFHQVIMSANMAVAPFERVINFAVLPREFSQEQGELTAKGSFNRKNIEKNYSELIDGLYVSNVVPVRIGELVINIPRWFYRDLGILEDDIIVEGDYLVNPRKETRLRIGVREQNMVRIGDLVYRAHSRVIDLGMFARQPALWLGNPELIRFSPIRESWDVPLGPIFPNIYVASFKERPYNTEELDQIKAGKDEKLTNANRIISRSFFLPDDQAYPALEELGKVFNEADPRLARAIRHRLEAFAFHPEEEMRALAYRIFLLKAPDPENPYLPAFIESGLSFLNEKSIREIACGNFGKHRLDALKRRLYWYRNNLHWPASKKMKEQFGTVLELLFKFASLHLEFYASIRSELSRWILHKKDPYLSRKAEEYFNKLAVIFEHHVDEKTPRFSASQWRSKLLFEAGIRPPEQERIIQVFSSTTFFNESVLLAFNQDLNLEEVPQEGIWIMRLLAFKDFNHYRVGINTKEGKHYDLHIVMSENPDFVPKMDTFYWMASMSGFPFGPAVTSRLGASRPKLGILSTQYIGGLTAWDKIREYSEISKSGGNLRANAWKKVFVRSFTVIFKAWQNSDYQIVPGTISSSNIMIPEMDFRESALIISLTGWSPYRNTLSLVEPMLQDFYCRTSAFYPGCKKHLDLNWIFDGCIEALGKDGGKGFLELLASDLRRRPCDFF
ncbi:MAG: AMP-binding protein [Syntrophothermus sp.]